MGRHHHGSSCGCPNHQSAPPARSGWWATLVPILACVVCPACIATYAKILSALGIGIALSETQHLWLLLVCVALSLGVGARELRATRHYGPMTVTFGGCAVLLALHMFGEDAGPSRLSWLGVTLLLGGAVWGHRVRLQRRRGRPRPLVAQPGEVHDAVGSGGGFVGVRRPAHAMDAAPRS